MAKPPKPLNLNLQEVEALSLLLDKVIDNGYGDITSVVGKSLLRAIKQKVDKLTPTEAKD